MSFDVKKLFVDVFHPEFGENILIVVDHPHGNLQDDNDAWKARREMAAEWHQQIASLAQGKGFHLLPLLSYPATGRHNADLPINAGEPLSLHEALKKATLAIALTEYSASAFMANWSKSKQDFRCASMPGASRSMEKTALAADYREVARRCAIVKNKFQGVTAAEVEFSTGHRCYFDLRYRQALKDDGQLPRNASERLINLPSGEVYIVPYEGERDNDPSKTAGEIPVAKNGEIIIFQVAENTISEVQGNSQIAQEWNRFFQQDPARRNIAELAIGCNPWAVVWGNVLEDEKAGFHWAYGRSDHLGGTMSVDKFKSKETVCHDDIVYAKDSPIQVVDLKFVHSDGKIEEIIRNKEYIIF